MAICNQFGGTLANIGRVMAAADILGSFMAQDKKQKRSAERAPTSTGV